jgi:hypothetical protein
MPCGNLWGWINPNKRDLNAGRNVQNFFQREMQKKIQRC